MSGNTFGIIQGTHPFNVNPNLPFVGHSIERQFARMRQIKLEGLFCMCCCQSRFSSRAGGELHRSRWYMQVSAKQRAQHPTSHNKVPPVALKIEALSA